MKSLHGGIHPRTLRSSKSKAFFSPVVNIFTDDEPKQMIFFIYIMESSKNRFLACFIVFQYDKVKKGKLLNFPNYLQFIAQK